MGCEPPKREGRSTGARGDSAAECQAVLKHSFPWGPDLPYSPGTSWLLVSSLIAEKVQRKGGEVAPPCGLCYPPAPWSFACLLSCFSHVRLWTVWTVTGQIPLSGGFSRKEYWSGVLYLPPGDLPNPGVKPKSLTSSALAGRFFAISAAREALQFFTGSNSLFS